MPRLFLLSLECGGLFVVLPLLIFYRRLPNLPIPYLLIAATAAFFVLLRDGSFDPSRFTSLDNFKPYLAAVVARNAICLVLLGVAVWLLAPHLLFSFVKRARALWALVMLLYPLLSVYPQEILYRAFFFHRYQPLFGSGWAMVMASAVAFGFVHVIFGNWLAVILCVIGGLLFSLTYQHSGSLLLTCLDHAMFGEFIFTIGLGEFFYHGSRT